MAWVGAGSADVFFHFGIHCWDMAAGLLRYLASALTTAITATAITKRRTTMFHVLQVPSLQPRPEVVSTTLMHNCLAHRKIEKNKRCSKLDFYCKS